jgi:UDP-N-acetylmuramate--alanine ligase
VGFFLVESCEYHHSFLFLEPKIIVVTNVEPDHLDFFGTEEKYYSAFRSFAEKLDEASVLIADFSNPKICEIFSSCVAERINTSDFLQHVPQMAIPGKHNRENAACVLAIASALGAPLQPVKHSLQNFHGTWRRFEKKGEKDGLLLFDDYAHHPTEVRATLASFREKFPDQKIWAVFQPHQYSRTREFLDGFSKSFADADEVLIPNIYRVRDTEADVASVSPEKLVEEIKKHNPNARYTQDFSNTATLLKAEAKPGDVIVTIGAGPVYRVGEEILKESLQNA